MEGSVRVRPLEGSQRLVERPAALEGRRRKDTLYGRQKHERGRQANRPDRDLGICDA